eukprot:1179599-Prorocentrum_minimum.AAC.5
MSRSRLASCENAPVRPSLLFSAIQIVQVLDASRQPRASARASAQHSLSAPQHSLSAPQHSLSAQLRRLPPMPVFPVPSLHAVAVSSGWPVRLRIPNLCIRCWDAAENKGSRT